MEWKVMNVYVDVEDAEGNPAVKLDGYFVVGYADGYLGNDDYELENKQITLKRYLEYVHALSVVDKKIAAYSAKGWDNVPNGTGLRDLLYSKKQALNEVVSMVKGENNG